tara:strand:- start:752 stop:1396 length:645 start_codon:yes stop_codon:yes gene_type:complete
MNDFKIAVFISGNGTNLQNLIDTKFLNNHNSLKISVVFSNNEKAFGLKRAKAHNIPYFTLNHKDFDSRENFDEEIINRLNEYDFDLLVLAGYMRILSEKFINSYRNKIINLHPSLLPKYPGLETHKKVIENKDKYHGATVHYVDSGLDTGQVIGFSKFRVETNNLNLLEEKVHEIEHKLLPLICSLIKNNYIEFKENVLKIEGHVYPNGKEFIF